jgi:predicted dehydrogenase
MDPIRIGVIGWGRRGQSLTLHILRASASHLFRVAAVSDSRESRLDVAREQFGAEPVALYGDYRDLLADPNVEAVLVETGAQAFAQISCDAMRAGKHVCADVPMAFTRQDVWDLVVTTEQTGCAYCMAEQVRYANFVMRWREHVEAGDIGEPLFVQGEYIHPEEIFYFEREDTGERALTVREGLAGPDYVKTWRNEFVDPIKYIPHELSPLLKIISDRVASVSCYTSDVRLFGPEVGMLDLQCALMHTDRGRTMRVLNSFTAPRGGKYDHHWYQIYGTDGVLETARPYWAPGCEAAASQEFIMDRTGEVTYTKYGWPRADSPFGDAAQGHGGLENFVFKQFHDAIRAIGENELDVYAMAEAVLPGIIAAESAAAGGVKLDVPDVRPNTQRARGTWPKGA